VISHATSAMMVMRLWATNERCAAPLRQRFLATQLSAVVLSPTHGAVRRGLTAGAEYAGAQHGERAAVELTHVLKVAGLGGRRIRQPETRVNQLRARNGVEQHDAQHLRSRIADGFKGRESSAARDAEKAVDGHTHRGGLHLQEDTRSLPHKETLASYRGDLACPLGRGREKLVKGADVGGHPAEGHVVAVCQGRQQLTLHKRPRAGAVVDGEERPQELATAFGGREEHLGGEIHAPADDLAVRGGGSGLLCGMRVGSQDGLDGADGDGLVGGGGVGVAETVEVVDIRHMHALDGGGKDAVHEGAEQIVGG